MLAGADPVLLLAEMREAQAELGKRVDERGMGAGRGAVPAPVDLARFAAGLRVARSGIGIAPGLWTSMTLSREVFAHAEDTSTVST